MSLRACSNQDWFEWQELACFRVSLGSVFKLVAQVERGSASLCKLHIRFFYKLHIQFSHKIHISLFSSSTQPIPR